MLDYYLILGISFLGLPVGWGLSSIAWEEVSDYENFLTGLKYACFAGLLASTFFLTGDKALGAVFAAATALIHYTGRERWAYAALPVFLWLSHGTEALPFAASIMMLYGFAEGSLNAKRMGEQGREYHGLLTVLKHDYWYLVIGALLGIPL